MKTISQHLQETLDAQHMNQDWTTEQDKEFDPNALSDGMDVDWVKVLDYIHHREALLIERVEKLLPPEDDGISEETRLPHYTDFNKGVVVGWNDYRQRVFTALQDLLASKEV